MTEWNKGVYRRWQILVFIVVWHEVATVNVNNACSARTDGICVRCDGVPQCFDLSDEIGCTNTTINLAPVRPAKRSCTDNGCMGRFPRPPPLPPFSLCKHVVKTTTETTTGTTVTTTPSTPEVTTQSTTVTSNEKTVYSTTPTTESTPLASTSQTTFAKTVSTQPMPRSSSTTESTTLSQAQSTQIPVLSTTQWLPTTTTKPDNTFMKVLWSCMTVNYRIEDVMRCVDRYYWCLKNRTCLLPLRINYSTKNHGTHPGTILNKGHVVKTRPNTNPSMLSPQISKKDRHEGFPKSTQATKRPVPKIKHRNHFFTTRMPYAHNQRHITLSPSPERRFKQISRTITPLPTSSLSPLFPVNQPRHMSRNPSISSRQVPWHASSRPATMSPWYRTTMPPYTPTPNPIGSFNNLDYAQYRTTNDDLVYALTVLQHF